MVGAVVVGEVVAVVGDVVGVGVVVDVVELLLHDTATRDSSIKANTTTQIYLFLNIPSSFLFPVLPVNPYTLIPAQNTGK